MVRSFATQCVTIAVLIALASILGAEQETRPRRNAAISLEEVQEPDFLYQGEWWGRPIAGRAAGNIGLQVVALGDGHFQARWFEGGLPGAGPVILPGYVLTGKRLDGRLELSDADGRRVILDTQTGLASLGNRQWHCVRFSRRSSTLGLRPPPGAVVLFADGASDRLSNVRLAPDGSLLAGAVTREAFGDCYLHVEFRTPYMPKARGQGRGNSGIYLQRRYEVQILDSFGLDPLDDGCGALYKLCKPDLSVCLPPLEWQTYDIYFRAPRFDSQGNKITQAEITVFHNGIGVHYHRAVPRKTGNGRPEGPEPLPILFQDHGNPVTFRNIWVVPDRAEPKPPVSSVLWRRRARLCW